MSNSTNLAKTSFHNYDFFFTIYNQRKCKEKNILYRKPLEKAIQSKITDGITLRRSYLNAEGREYNQYGNLPYNKLSQIWKINNGFYEILSEYRKLYFDIEYPTDLNENKESQINNLINECIKEILKKLQINYKSSQFAISQVHSKYTNGPFKGVDKYSAHIIYNCNKSFHSVEDIKIFKDYLSTLLLEEKYKDLWFGKSCAIDTKVYGKNQAFKLPYQAKSSNKYKQIPLFNNLDTIYLKSFLVSYKAECMDNIDVSLIKTENNKKFNEIKKKHNLFHIPQKNQSTILTYSMFLEKIPKEKYYKDEEIQEVNIETLLKYIYNDDGLPYQVYMAVGTALKRCCNDKGYAFQLWDEWTKKCRNNYDKAYNKQQFNGYSEESCGYNTLLYLSSLCNPQVNKFNKNPLNFILNDDLSNTYTTKEIVTQRFIQITKPQIQKYKYIFIKSPMGTGKSYMLHKLLNYKEIKSRYVNALGQRKVKLTRMFKRCVYLSSRQAFACSMASDFKEDGFINYLDKDNFNGDNEKVIISMESLQRLNYDECDLLIIDESESIFNIISSETLLNNGVDDNLQKLKNLIQNSNKILIMDAFLTNRSFKAIIDINQPTEDKVEKENSYYLNNKFQYEERTAKEWEKNQMISYIISLLHENKRVVLCSGSKKYGDKIIKNILEHFPDFEEGEEILFYNKYNQLPNETNVNEEWSKCNLLIYSPTITCGISYTNTDHPFDNLFIYCVNKNSSHFRDTIQAHKRVRYFNNKNIGICINDAYDGFSIEQNPINFNIIKDYLRDYRYNLFKKEDYETITLEESNLLKDWVFEIHCFNIMEKNIHSIFLREVVSKYFELENIKWIQELDCNNLDITELETDDWLSEDIDLIDQETFEEYTREFERKEYDMKKYKEMRKFKFYEKFDEEQINKFDEVFNEWFMEDRRKYINNITSFKSALKQEIQKYINKNNPTKYVEYFKQNLIAYQHTSFILDKLNIIKDHDVDFSVHFNTLDFEPLIEHYKDMKSLSINQLFRDEYYNTKNDKGEIKKVTTRTIHSILNKLLKEYFNYEIESCGKKQKTINGKKKKVTIYKIIPNQEKENNKLPPIKNDIFKYIKLGEMLNMEVEDLYDFQDEEELTL